MLHASSSEIDTVALSGVYYPLEETNNRRLELIHDKNFMRSSNRMISGTRKTWVPCRLYPMAHTCSVYKVMQN